MSSFLQKLKGEGIIKTGEAGSTQASGKVPSNVAKVDLDVYQTGTEIVVYAIIPGSKEADIEVLIEGDNDIVTLRGLKNRPEGIFGNGYATHEGQFLVEECMWGEFYRQIILPEKIDSSASEAKYKDGILVIKLPLLVASNNKTRLKVSKVEDGPKQAQ